MSENKHTPETNDIAATLALSLKADSGYSCETSYRISAKTWGEVIRVCEGSASIDLLTKQRDELLAELEHAANYHDSHECYAEGKRLRKLIASIKGES